TLLKQTSPPAPGTRARFIHQGACKRMTTHPGGPWVRSCRSGESFGDVESDLFVARGDERFGIAGANAAGVGDMPISWNGFGPEALLFLLLDAPFLTAFSPKKRCPFQLVPVTALATCERLR